VGGGKRSRRVVWMNFFSFVSAGTLTHIFGTAGEVLGVVGRWFDGLHP
jgi:hypothetical protein